MGVKNNLTRRPGSSLYHMTCDLRPGGVQCHRRLKSLLPIIFLSFRPEGGICFLERKRYYVYIMASKSRILYVGVTGFLQSRVLEHKARETPCFTQRYNVT